MSVDLSCLLDGQLAVITLNCPEVKNALGPAEWQKKIATGEFKNIAVTST